MPWYDAQTPESAQDKPAAHEQVRAPSPGSAAAHSSNVGFLSPGSLSLTLAILSVVLLMVLAMTLGSTSAAVFAPTATLARLPTGSNAVVFHANSLTTERHSGHEWAIFTLDGHLVLNPAKVRITRGKGDALTLGRAWQPVTLDRLRTSLARPGGTIPVLVPHLVHPGTRCPFLSSSSPHGELTWNGVPLVFLAGPPVAGAAAH